jgi:hypothetical protein
MKVYMVYKVYVHHSIHGVLLHKHNKPYEPYQPFLHNPKVCGLYKSLNARSYTTNPLTPFKASA